MPKIDAIQQKILIRKAGILGCVKGLFLFHLVLRDIVLELDQALIVLRQVKRRETFLVGKAHAYTALVGILIFDELFERTYTLHSIVEDRHIRLKIRVSSTASEQCKSRNRISHPRWDEIEDGIKCIRDIFSDLEKMPTYPIQMRRRCIVMVIVALVSSRLIIIRHHTVLR